MILGMVLFIRYELKGAKVTADSGSRSFLVKVSLEDGAKVTADSYSSAAGITS